MGRLLGLDHALHSITNERVWVDTGARVRLASLRRQGTLVAASSATGGSAVVAEPTSSRGRAIGPWGFSAPGRSLAPKGVHQTPRSSLRGSTPVDEHRASALRAVAVLLGIGLSVQFPGAVRLSLSDLVVILAIWLFASKIVIGRWNFPIILAALLGYWLLQLYRGEVFQGGLSTWAMHNKTIGLLGLVVLMVTVSSLARSVVFRVWLLRSWVLFGAGVAVLATAFNLAGVPQLTSVGRPAGLFEDPNAFAVNAAVLVGLVSLLPRDVIMLGAGGRIAVVGALTVAVYASDSRTGMLALAATLAVVAAYTTRSLLRSKTGALGFLLFSVLVIVALRLGLADAAAEPFQRRQFTVDSRLDKISEGLELFGSHPLVGAGIGSSFQGGLQIHNTVVWVLADLGLIGMMLLLSLLVWAFLSAWRAARSAAPQTAAIARASIAGLAGMSVASFGVEALYQRSWWVLIALAAYVAWSCQATLTHAAAGKDSFSPSVKAH